MTVAESRTFLIGFTWEEARGWCLENDVNINARSTIFVSTTRDLLGYRITKGDSVQYGQTGRIDYDTPAHVNYARIIGGGV